MPLIPDLGGENVLKAFEMAIRQADDTNGIRESFLSGFFWIYFQLRPKIFFCHSYRGRLPPSPPPMVPPLTETSGTDYGARSRSSGR